MEEMVSLLKVEVKVTIVTHIEVGQLFMMLSMLNHTCERTHCRRLCER